MEGVTITPDERARASAQRWLKTSIRETLRIAKNLEEKMSSFDEDSQIEAQKIITDLRQQAKRCSHHGLGISVQELLPLKPKE
jgi:tellurite resistance protein